MFQGAASSALTRSKARPFSHFLCLPETLSLPYHAANSDGLIYHENGLPKNLKKVSLFYLYMVYNTRTI